MELQAIEKRCRTTMLDIMHRAIKINMDDMGRALREFDENSETYRFDPSGTIYRYYHRYCDNVLYAIFNKICANDAEYYIDAIFETISDNIDHIEYDDDGSITKVEWSNRKTHNHSCVTCAVEILMHMSDACNEFEISNVQLVKSKPAVELVVEKILEYAAILPFNDGYDRIVEVITERYEPQIKVDKFKYENDILSYVEKQVVPMIRLMPHIHNKLYGILNCDGIDGRDLLSNDDRLIMALQCVAEGYTNNIKKERKSSMANYDTRNEDSRKKDMFGGIMEKMMPKRIEGGEVAMTLNGGIAIRRKDGDYVQYDAQNNRIVNSMQFVIQSDTMNKFMFLMPVAANQLSAGDIIKNNNTYYYVKEVYAGGIKTVSLNSGAHSNVVDEVNIAFGTAMYQKVVTLFNMNGQQTSTAGGFQFNPMMLAFMSDRDGGNDDMIETMLMMQMMGGQNPFAGMFGMNNNGVQNQ